MQRLCCFVLALSIFISGVARADEVYFKNGDRLSGKIVSAADGKMIIDTKLAGKITVNLADVRTFMSDGPVKIRMQDNTYVNQKVIAGKDGTVTAAGLTGQTRPVLKTITLAKVLKINEEEPRWTGSIVANGQFVRNAGKSEQFGLTATADKKSETDEASIAGSYLYGRSKLPGQTETTNADNWFATARYQSSITKKAYDYTSVRAEQDLVNFLDLRLTPGMGLGYQWVASKDFNFKTEAGVAYVYEQLGDGGGTNEDLSASMAYHVDKNFFDGHLSVYNDLQFLPTIRDPSNYLILSTLGVKTPINDQLFSEVKLIINYDSKPAPQAERTDEQLLVGIGYKF